MLLLAAGPARAVEQDPLEAAQQAEAAGQPRQAVELYRSVLASNPPAGVARRAEARLNWLMARDQDDFRPLAALFQEEMLDRTAPSDDHLRAFTKTIDGFPPGLVRREARAFVAGALARQKDWQAALAAYRTWLNEPGLDEADRRLAATGAAGVEVNLGSLSGALDVLKQAGFGQSAEARELRALRIAEVGRPIAYACLALFGLAALASLAGVVRRRRWRSVLSLPRVLVAVYALSIPFVVGTLYNDILRTRLWQLAWGLAGVLLLASISGAGLQAMRVSRRWSIAVAASACLACLAVGFLVASHTELFESLLLWRGI